MHICNRPDNHKLDSNACTIIPRIYAHTYTSLHIQTHAYAHAHNHTCTYPCTVSPQYFNPSERRMMDDSSDGGGNFMFTSDIGGASDMDTSAVDTPMVRRMSVLAEVNRPRDDSSTSNDDIGPPLKCVWVHGWCGRMCGVWLVTECVVFQDCGCMYGADLYLYIKASHMNATHPHPSGCLPARAHLPTHCRTR